MPGADEKPKRRPGRLLPADWEAALAAEEPPVVPPWLGRLGLAFAALAVVSLFLIPPYTRHVRERYQTLSVPLPSSCESVWASSPGSDKDVRVYVSPLKPEDLVAYYSSAFARPWKDLAWESQVTTSATFSTAIWTTRLPMPPASFTEAMMFPPVGWERVRITYEKVVFPAGGTRPFVSTWKSPAAKKYSWSGIEYDDFQPYSAAEDRIAAISTKYGPDAAARVRMGYGLLTIEVDGDLGERVEFAIR